MPAQRFSTVSHIAWIATTVGVTAVSATACGRAGEQRAAKTFTTDADPAANAGAGASAAAGPFRVALLTPGPISDQSWNSGAYNGLLAIRDSLGAQISHVQTKTPAEFEENFRQYGAKGYSLVFGHGFEFQDAAARVGPSYPKTFYITTSGNAARGNVAGMTFAFEQPSYLAGIVAGRMTKTGTVGVIGGTELPPVKSSFDAFSAGVHAANPKARVLTSYIGNWDDVSAGKEQALAQIGRGADIIFQNADAAGLGVFQAVRERHVYAFGSNSNQNAVAPDVVLGSVVIDLPRAFLRVAREVKAHTFRGEVVTLGLDTRVVTFVMNPALAARVPASVTAAVDSATKEIEAGRLKPGGSPAATAAGSGIKVSEARPGG